MNVGETNRKQGTLDDKSNGSLPGALKSSQYMCVTYTFAKFNNQTLPNQMEALEKLSGSI